MTTAAKQAPKLGMNMLLWSTDVTGPEYDATFELLLDAGYEGVEIPIFDSEVEKYGRLGKRLDELGLAALGVGARTAATSPIERGTSRAGSRASSAMFEIVSIPV